MEIHELTAIGEILGTEVLPLDDESATYKAAMSDLASYVIENHETSGLYGSTIKKVKTALSDAYTKLTTLRTDVNALQTGAAYKNNSTETIGTTTHKTVENGFITATAGTIYLSIPLSKSTSSVGRVSASSVKGRFRGINGIVNNESTDVEYTGTGYSVNAVISGDHRAVLTITANNGFTNATNNTPVSFYGIISLSFFTS